ncbi:hypothetical protein [Catellatospora sp. NPDC049609]|uniref:hypothetical protein n=1 Tax=Catellatospora sp. NPDC049609 TaxID=3155505 RepID=UPI0034167C4F
MLDFIAGMIGGWLGASWSQRRELRRARARQAALLAGEPVRIPCAMRDLGAGQTQWRHGDLLLAAGRAWWTPPGMSSRKVTLGPAGLTVTGDRPVTAQEGWGLNPACRVLSVRLDGREMELAIPGHDLTTAAQVLPLATVAHPASGTA